MKLDTAEDILDYFDVGGVSPNYQSNREDGMGCRHYDHSCEECRHNTETAERLALAMRVLERVEKIAAGTYCSAKPVVQRILEVAQKEKK